MYLFEMVPSKELSVANNEQGLIGEFAFFAVQMIWMGYLV
jgi:hypothetical protein